MSDMVSVGTAGVYFCCIRNLEQRSCVQPCTRSVHEPIDLVVTESARGMGLGKLLMQTAQEWAHVRGLDYIELGVLSNNRGAIALYEQLGYEHNTSIMRKALK